MLGRFHIKSCKCLNTHLYKAFFKTEPNKKKRFSCLIASEELESSVMGIHCQSLLRKHHFLNGLQLGLMLHNP
jgi:hypothetical protein